VLVECWSSLLAAEDVEIDSSVRPTTYQGEQAKLPKYTDGVARRGGVSVGIFTGPAIDTEIGSYVHYLALDYGRGFWASRKRQQVEQFVGDIERILLAKGAHRREIEMDSRAFRSGI
jgi:hypothetical protein